MKHSQDFHITPPPELVQQWSRFQGDTNSEALWFRIANEAAQWGADQELEACCEWVSQWRCLVGGSRPEVGLRAARRPKPPSLKEQALKRLAEAELTLIVDPDGTIRRALE
jgi:hypothetical protein